MEAKIRFYLDENIPVVIADQLKLRGIDAVTARDVGRLGDTDLNHLTYATSLGRVFCTFDSDYVDLAVSGLQHSGIVFGQQHKHGIGVWVNFLELMCGVYTPEEMQNHLEYL